GRASAEITRQRVSAPFRLRDHALGDIHARRLEPPPRRLDAEIAAAAPDVQEPAARASEPAGDEVERQSDASDADRIGPGHPSLRPVGGVEPAAGAVREIPAGVFAVVHGLASAFARNSSRGTMGTPSPKSTPPSVQFTVSASAS